MGGSNPIRVITVDDHEIVRGGIKFLLLAFDDIELVAEARDGQEALDLCEQDRPDVILMDMMMPGMDGPTATRAVRQKYPQVQVLALTSFYDRELVQRAMQAGAAGYLLKGTPIDELAHAIRSAHAGQSTLSREAVQALVDVPQPGPALGGDLSQRELEVLGLLVQGLSNAQIADQLVISLPTVKSHVHNILSKLQASSRTEAVSLAIKHKLVPS